MCISGASGSDRRFSLFSMLTEPNTLDGNFQPNYELFLYFHRFWQPIYNQSIVSLGNSIKFENCDFFDFEEFNKDAIYVSLSELSASFSNKEIEQKLLLVNF